MKYLAVLLSIIPLILSTTGFADSPGEVFSRERATRFLTEDILSEPLPKFSAVTGEILNPNPWLKLKKPSSPTSPLLAQAQRKGTAEFQSLYCQKVLSKYFPEIDCANPYKYSWAAIERNDRPEDLLSTWTNGTVTDLSKIPPTGKTGISLWSDDYWKIRFGATSYRYSSNKYFSSYKDAIAAYAQPLEWTQLLATPNPASIPSTLVTWSPAEKYDLLTGDEEFTLTNQQKKEGQQYVGTEGDVESWMGICHGWSAASIMVPPAMKPVTLTGAKSKEVTWYPHDIRALASLAWANGSVKNAFIGGRCNAKDPAVLPNGRLKDLDCFDNNPATFHLVLGNQIGLAQSSFVMDTSFDYEVWNQPVHSYEFVYFNALNPEKTSSDWKNALVPYDATFKASDRFQKPLTRGKRSGDVYNDSEIKFILGVTAKVTYAGEVHPSHSPQAQETQLIEVYYEYDLEISDRNGILVPTGGEWHTNYHPDFLWVPEKGTVAKSLYDHIPLTFDGKNPPPLQLTLTARTASKFGYPLCTVLSKLVRESSASNTEYVCR